MDISELKKSGQLTVIDASPVPFALNDDQLNIIYLNPEFINTFGYTLEEIPHLETWWPKAYPDPQYRQWVADEWNNRLVEAKASGSNFEPMEVRIRCKNGEDKDVVAYARSLEKEFLGTHLVILYDITEQKKSQKALEDLNATLELRVLKRTRELEEAKRQLEQLATKDALTNIFNRRYFNDHIRSEWLRLKREKQPLSLLIIDVDFFKLFNDHYGHLAGDDCLVKIANVLDEEAQRSSDHAARYGGEEFVCILPNTNNEGAMTIAERVRLGVQSLQIHHDLSSISDYVTVSVGVATCFPSAENDITEIMEMADRCLYLAKAQGRNRAVSCI